MYVIVFRQAMLEMPSLSLSTILLSSLLFLRQDILHAFPARKRGSQIYEMGRITVEGTSHGRGRKDKPHAIGSSTTSVPSLILYVNQMPLGKAVKSSFQHG